MNGGRGVSADESRLCYCVRSTIPQKASSIRIPLTDGDLSLKSSAFVQTKCIRTVIHNCLQTAEQGVDP